MSPQFYCICSVCVGDLMSRSYIGVCRGGVCESDLYRLTRASSKSVLQECQVRESSKNVLQEC